MKKAKKLLSVLLVAVLLLTAVPMTGLEASAAKAIKTKSEAVAWLNSQENATYDFNGANGTQCVEFVKAYVNWLLSGNAWQDCWNRPTLNGNTIWQNSLWSELGWTVYENTADFVPQPGDIFSAGKSNGNHTGIVISSNVSTAVIADANARNSDWSDGDPVRIHTITWKSASSDNAYGATHYIRPNFSDTSVPTISYANIAEGTYYLKNNSNNLYLSVDGAKDANKQNISVSAFNAGSEMKLAISKASSGYKMRPLCSSSRLVNPFADTVVSGKNVNLYDNTGDSSQWWGFESVSGGYVVRNMQNPSCVLALSGTNVIVSTYTGASNQIWTLEKVIPAHTCDKGTLLYYADSHPHYAYYRCSICSKEWVDKTKSNYSSACLSCAPVGEATVTVSATEIRLGETLTVNWSSVANAASYTLKYTQKYADSERDYTTVCSTTEISGSIEFPAVGKYYVFVDSIGVNGDSEQSELVGVNVMPASDDDRVMLHGVNVTAESNSTITVPIYLNNAALLKDNSNGEFGGAQFDLYYDNAQLELIDFIAEGLTDMYDCSAMEIDDTKGSVLLVYGLEYDENDNRIEYINSFTEDMTGDTLLGYLEFYTHDSFTGSSVEIDSPMFLDNSSLDLTNFITVGEPFMIYSADVQKASEVEAQINNLGEITALNQKDAVKKARTAYDALTEYQKSLVTNLGVLTAAEEKIAKLQAAADKTAADKKTAEAVDRLIDALGEITSTDQAVNVALVRNEYEKLTDAQKKLVVKYDALVKAENTIEQLRNPSRLMGDVDFSGVVDVADILKAKALIMSEDWSGEELQAGDLNASGSLDVGDIMGVKNIIMGA